MFYPNVGTNDVNTLQVADMLPSKTIPEVNRKGHACILKVKAKIIMALKNKARDCFIEVEETEDDNSPRNVTVRHVSLNVSITLITSFQFSSPKKVCSLLCHTQFHFNQNSRRQKLQKRVQFICSMRLS